MSYQVYLGFLLILLGLVIMAHGCVTMSEASSSYAKGYQVSITGNQWSI